MKSNQVNNLQIQVGNDNMRRKNTQWNHLDEHHVQEFPHLTIVYLRDLTMGTYQHKLASSNIQNIQCKENHIENEIDAFTEQENVIRLRFFSQFQKCCETLSVH